MARKRMIDPEFFLDEGLAELDPRSRLLYIGLWTIADDRVFTLPYRPAWIKAQVFPYNNVDVEQLLNELMTAGKVLRFDIDNKSYLFVPNMARYQKIDRPSNQKYPAHPQSEQYIGRVISEHSTSTLSEVKLSKDKLSKYSLVARDIIKYFNEKAGTRFTHTNPKTISLISARLEEGHVPGDFKIVVDKKVKQWKFDEKMCKFLRPKTLFNETNFDNYLGEVEKKIVRRGDEQ